MRSQKLQMAQWDRLENLFQKRSAIEERIFVHLKLLEQESLNLTTQLEAMFVGRLEDISEVQLLQEKTQEAPE